MTDTHIVTSARARLRAAERALRSAERITACGQLQAERIVADARRDANSINQAGSNWPDARTVIRAAEFILKGTTSAYTADMRAAVDVLSKACPER